MTGVQTCALPISTSKPYLRNVASLDDDIVVLRAKRLEAITQFMSAIEPTKADQAYISSISEQLSEQLVDGSNIGGLIGVYRSVIANIMASTIPSVPPMEPTPMPMNFGSHYLKKVPVRPNIEALEAEVREISEAIQILRAKAEGGNLDTGELAAQNDRLSATQERLRGMVPAYINYWEGIFGAAMRRKSIEKEYANGVNLMMGAQSDSAAMVISNQLKAIGAMSMQFTGLAVLAAGHAYLSQFDHPDIHELQYSINLAMNEHIYRATNGAITKGAEILLDLLQLPRDAGSVKCFFASIGIPTPVADILSTKYGGGPKRDLIRATVAWLVYTAC